MYIYINICFYLYRRFKVLFAFHHFVSRNVKEPKKVWYPCTFMDNIIKSNVCFLYKLMPIFFSCTIPHEFSIVDVSPSVSTQLYSFFSLKVVVNCLSSCTSKRYGLSQLYFKKIGSILQFSTYFSLKLRSIAIHLKAVIYLFFFKLIFFS